MSPEAEKAKTFRVADFGGQKFPDGNTINKICAQKKCVNYIFVTIILCMFVLVPLTKGTN